MLLVKRKRIYRMFFSIIALCILIEPAMIAEVSGSVHRIYSILKVFVAINVLFLFFAYRLRPSKLAVIAIVFELMLFLPTIMNRMSSVSDWFKDGAYLIILIFLMQILLKVDPVILIDSLSVVLGSYVHINTICRLIFPGGMYRSQALGYMNCWFLGYDNVAIIFIILSASLAFYRTEFRGRTSLWDLSVLVSGLAFTFMTGVATAIISESAFWLFLVVCKNEHIRKLACKAKWVVLGMFIVFFLIQFIFTAGNALLTKLFLLLGKSSTFSGRTRVWLWAWAEMALTGNWWGHGTLQSEDYLRMTRIGFAVHLHSYYLQIIFEGGGALICSILCNGVSCCPAV